MTLLVIINLVGFTFRRKSNTTEDIVIIKYYF